MASFIRRCQEKRARREKNLLAATARRFIAPRFHTKLTSAFIFAPGIFSLPSLGAPRDEKRSLAVAADAAKVPRALRQEKRDSHAR